MNFENIPLSRPSVVHILLNTWHNRNNNLFVGGDFNFYDYLEPACQEILFGQSLDLVDPINQMGSWHNNSSYANIHTQSTRSATGGFAGGAYGGMDDRFDIIFTSNDVISGSSGIQYISGSYVADGQDGSYFNQSILDFSPEERSRMGIFLSFQYPVEIPGITNTNFLRTALNSILKAQGKDKMSPPDFLSKLKEGSAKLGISSDMLKRSVNLGFSGGEKKRNEMLQMVMIEPKLSILDETDSGLDIDALKVVANGVNDMKNSERSFLIITHYQRLLDYIVPDFVHIMVGGKIVKSGGSDLAAVSYTHLTLPTKA